MLTASERLAEFARDGEIDFSYTVRGLARFRVNAFRQRGSISIACRVVPFDIRAADELGSARGRDAASPSEPRGIILVTGTTGSGKSTTLAAMVDHINRTYARNIVTIEDPIEYLHRDQRSVVHQREIGFDTSSFAQALRRVLRQDPDVILIGEMRDEETVGTALSAAETGHLVLEHAAHDRRGRDRQPDHRLLPAAPPPAGARDAGGLAARRDLAAAGARRSTA